MQQQKTSKIFSEIVFNKDGLIPAIAQDFESGDVLMMAWMNPESVKLTLETKKVTYWSRSRGELWRKGESSGHQQKLVSMRLDCDMDCLLLIVEQTGPACHTNRKSCFFYEMGEETVDIILEPVK